MGCLSICVKKMFSNRIQSTTVPLKGVILSFGSFGLVDFASLSNSIRFSVISNLACSFCSHNFRSRSCLSLIADSSSCCLASHFHRSVSSRVRHSLDSKKSVSLSFCDDNPTYLAFVSFFY